MITWAGVLLGMTPGVLLGVVTIHSIYWWFERERDEPDVEDQAVAALNEATEMIRRRLP